MSKGWQLAWMWHGQLIYHMFPEAVFKIIWRPETSKMDLLGCQTDTANNCCDFPSLQAKRVIYLYRTLKKPAPTAQHQVVLLQHRPQQTTHRSSLSSLFCPWAVQRWCYPAAQTGCPGSWPGRSGNHCLPRSPCGSLPSPSETCCLWACSWWICVRRDLQEKEAKSWSWSADLPSYSKESGSKLT